MFVGQTLRGFGGSSGLRTLHRCFISLTTEDLPLYGRLVSSIVHTVDSGRIMPRSTDQQLPPAKGEVTMTDSEPSHIRPVPTLPPAV